MADRRRKPTVVLQSRQVPEARKTNLMKNLRTKVKYLNAVCDLEQVADHDPLEYLEGWKEGGPQNYYHARGGFHTKTPSSNSSGRPEQVKVTATRRSSKREQKQKLTGEARRLPFPR